CNSGALVLGHGAGLSVMAHSHGHTRQRAGGAFSLACCWDLCLFAEQTQVLGQPASRTWMCILASERCELQRAQQSRRRSTDSSGRSVANASAWGRRTPARPTRPALPTHTHGRGEEPRAIDQEQTDRNKRSNKQQEKAISAVINARQATKQTAGQGQNPSRSPL